MQQLNQLMRWRVYIVHSLLTHWDGDGPESSAPTSLKYTDSRSEAPANFCVAKSWMLWWMKRRLWRDADCGEEEEGRWCKLWIVGLEEGSWCHLWRKRRGRGAGAGSEGLMWALKRKWWQRLCGSRPASVKPAADAEWWERLWQGMLRQLQHHKCVCLPQFM